MFYTDYLCFTQISQISRKELHRKECSQLPSGAITLDEVDKHERKRRAFCEICEICVKPKSVMKGNFAFFARFA